MEFHRPGMTIEQLVIKKWAATRRKQYAKII